MKMKYSSRVLVNYTLRMWNEFCISYIWVVDQLSEFFRSFSEIKFSTSVKKLSRIINHYINHFNVKLDMCLS